MPDVNLLLGLVVGGIGLAWWCFRLEARQERIIDTLNRIQKESHTEHSALLEEVRETRKLQAEEHKEMIVLIGSIKEPLIEAVAVLKSHVNEERRK